MMLSVVTELVGDALGYTSEPSNALGGPAFVGDDHRFGQFDAR
jgi:hypothetical protein